MRISRSATGIAAVLGTLASLSASGRGAPQASPAITAAAQVDASGTWNGTGSDVQGAGSFTWQLTQAGNLVSGTAILKNTSNDGTCASCHKNKAGTFSGTLSGSALTFQIDFPSGAAADPTPLCSLTITGRLADVTSSTTTGTYSGADSCEGPFSNGTLGMTPAPVPPAITSPASQGVRPGQAAQFAVTASGRPAPQYQWQVSTDSGRSWTNLAEGAVTTGTATPALTVAAASVSLNRAQYRCVATNSAGSATSGAATLFVNSVLASPGALQFAATKAGASGPLTDVTPPQDVAVTVTGASTAWTASADQPWVQIVNGSGSASGRFAIAVVNPNNVLGGSTTGSATVTVTVAATGLVATVPVAVTVQLSGTSAAPFGFFDTPLDGATGLSGSIALTGWALDDIGVDRVEIWRDVAPGETTPPHAGPGPGQGKIFIATPQFISGARPDVEGAFATSPLAYRSGWGYLLLTWGLWQQGNGPFTLYAFAFDKAGNSTTLGTKRIVVDNARAARPFGAIDIPGDGETRSGSFYNFGWALTPNEPGGTCVITNGNVGVTIDSGPSAPVMYGAARSDVAAIFPNFTNSTGPSGAALVDTTTLTDGVHQIVWLVKDSCGRQDGIGSRFFTVFNGTAASTLAATAADMPDRGIEATALHLTAGWNQDPIGVRRADGEWQWASPPADGTRVVAIDEMERVEARLPLAVGTYAGYHIVNGVLRPLPPGSSLDGRAGRFSWQPAAGFVGTYDLAFVSSRAGENRDPHHLRVVVGPPVRMVIETPRAWAEARQPFLLAGWALDLAAPEGSGVDTVHVWAYPLAGGGPIFLGASTSGDPRLDVAAAYGAQFAHASYAVVVDHLPPGSYELVAYAHCVSTGTFCGAQVRPATIR